MLVESAPPKPTSRDVILDSIADGVFTVDHIDTKALSVLMHHHFSGNVRELIVLSRWCPAGRTPTGLSTSARPNSVNETGSNRQGIRVRHDSSGAVSARFQSQQDSQRARHAQDNTLAKNEKAQHFVREVPLMLDRQIHPVSFVSTTAGFREVTGEQQ
ncbi:MAG: hypothetical protein A2289_03015 [Deltaproteobacteria bacterium RIFOXYA12_FULL_58_15]|nr:MAG: hypothetical protein A2289_03015 [Deltaproteobacteria bacterium RIFOXYA12_FULL_58_15]